MLPECDPFVSRFDPEIAAPLAAGKTPLAGMRLRSKIIMISQAL